MRITGFDHVTIRVSPEKVEAMRAFYADLLGLRVGPRLLSFPGVWLYLDSAADGQAVVHVAGNIGEVAGAVAAPDAPGFDHVAFRTRGLAAAKQRLSQAGLSWKEVWRPHLSILQLVVYDPAGTKVELTFDPSEHPGEVGAPAPPPTAPH